MGRRGNGTPAPAGSSHLKLNRRLYPFQFPCPPAKLVEFWRTYYGPTLKAFAALHQDLEALWIEHNTATDGTTFVEAEYLEVTAIRQ